MIKDLINMGWSVLLEWRSETLIYIALDRAEVWKIPYKVVCSWLFPQADITAPI